MQPNYQTVESKAQRVLRRFIGKAKTSESELFADYIASKAMTMYLGMHIEAEAFMDAPPHRRFKRYIYEWMNPSMREQRKCYLDRRSTMLTN